MLVLRQGRMAGFKLTHHIARDDLELTSASASRGLGFHLCVWLCSDGSQTRCFMDTRRELSHILSQNHGDFDLFSGWGKWKTVLRLRPVGPSDEVKCAGMSEIQ